MSSLKSRLHRLQGIKNDESSNEYTNSVTSVDNFQVVDRVSQEQTVVENQLLTAKEPYAEQWKALDVNLMSNEHGEFLMRTHRYDSSHYHGMHQLSEWQQVAHHLQAFFPDQQAHANNILFLDLETTGLGVGTGNIPFMIGLAFWENDTLIVQQALIRHPAEERAMLAHLHHLTKSYTHLISYNGKSFDWPLVHSRYVINGMRQEIWEPLHIDLLHPSRSLWRNTLESCKLSHIEEMRLGISRVEDVPGSEAPRLYFEYLSDGNPKILEGVFLHNEIDMLSLVSLATRFAHLLSDTEITHYVQQPSEPEEMVRTGLWLEKMGFTTYSEQLYTMAVHVPTTASNTLMLLAMRDKKQQNMARALTLWHRMVDHIGLFPQRDEIDAAIELSMYYEHKTKEFDEAYRYATIALEASLKHVNYSRRKQRSEQQHVLAIRKRLARLEKKQGINM
ncbi:MAG: ribonuclease H-like domain-containing protein [Candidatus Pristimantibacillus lignocellulolyticus]|uniref:Ribonuclease H-like domain-containing protein n=1 Tax=Candidatus Pristimantibacillus lignocellulolyticus TaxID=2994561 RepID=A0A9J6ZCU0_9BACL|nr:MAG: ribonuclease H-like domain-containing protein [Candidatus Pristimantibacillus lignocellulolyticus]